MFDIASPKIITPAVLFAALSPGLLLQLPRTLKIASGRTSRESVFFHALVFMVAYYAIAKARGIQLRKADLLVPGILFMLLSPGILLQLPDTIRLMSGATSIQSVIVHTLVFAVVFAFLRVQFPQFY